ncbi:hypothetical protein Tco_0071523 [Tanacetum coccineum]|uniref:C2H2-type domain-containing protein n=1 Tax=Tanacetum coccineum TaxID=301880 RepID=A0ABQ4ZFC0_9ASTR
MHGEHQIWRRENFQKFANYSCNKCGDAFLPLPTHFDKSDCHENKTCSLVKTERAHKGRCPKCQRFHSNWMESLRHLIICESFSLTLARVTVLGQTRGIFIDGAEETGVQRSFWLMIGCEEFSAPLESLTMNQIHGGGRTHRSNLAMASFFAKDTYERRNGFRMHYAFVHDE